MFKEWNKAFDKLRHKYETWQIFRDFLDMTIDNFTIPGMQPLFTHKDRYTDQEYEWFGELFTAYMKGMQKALEDHDYYDFLGTWWESDVNMTNKFRAQFFTPLDVCVLMEELTVTDLGESPRVMYDCCCGSGRFGLVHHHLRPQDYYFFNDLDDYAVKMTIFNMLFHGMRGVVAHMNTLTEEVFNCWQVTPYMNEGLPYIVPYGTDIRGALSFLPRGRIIEAPTPAPPIKDKGEDKKPPVKNSGGLDSWLTK